MKDFSLVKWKYICWAELINKQKMVKVYDDVKWENVEISKKKLRYTAKFCMSQKWISTVQWSFFIFKGITFPGPDKCHTLTKTYFCSKAEIFKFQLLKFARIAVLSFWRRSNLPFPNWAFNQFRFGQIGGIMSVV